MRGSTRDRSALLLAFAAGFSVMFTVIAVVDSEAWRAAGWAFVAGVALMGMIVVLVA